MKGGALNVAPPLLEFLNANSNTYICTIIYLVTWSNYEHLPLLRLFMYVQCTGLKHFYSANMPEYSRYTCYKISAFLLKSPAKCAKKPLLPFKEDQGDTYEWYNGKISISFFQLEKFSTLFIFTLFSVDLWST